MLDGARCGSRPRVHGRRRGRACPSLPRFKQLVREEEGALRVVALEDVADRHSAPVGPVVDRDGHELLLRLESAVRAGPVALRPVGHPYAGGRAERARVTVVFVLRPYAPRPGVRQLDDPDVAACRPSSSRCARCSGLAAPRRPSRSARSAVSCPCSLRVPRHQGAPRRQALARIRVRIVSPRLGHHRPRGHACCLARSRASRSSRRGRPRARRCACGWTRRTADATVAVSERPRRSRVVRATPARA